MLPEDFPNNLNYQDYRRLLFERLFRLDQLPKNLRCSLTLSVQRLCILISLGDWQSANQQATEVETLIFGSDIPAIPQSEQFLLRLLILLIRLNIPKHRKCAEASLFRICEDLSEFRILMDHFINLSPGSLDETFTYNSQQNGGCCDT